MKRSELKQLIKEEIKKTLNESKAYNALKNVKGFVKENEAINLKSSPKSEFKDWSKWYVDFYEDGNKFATVYYDLMDDLGFRDKLKQALNKALNEYNDFGDSSKDKLIFFVYNDEFYPNYKEVEVARWSRSNGLDIMTNEN